MSKKITKFERELLRERRGAGRVKNSELLSSGLRVCRNVNCQSLGVPMQIELFYKVKSRPDGYDCYCFECRKWFNVLSRDKDEERAKRWNRVREINRKLRNKRKKTTVEAAHKEQLCKLHPWMLSEDCEIGPCGERKRDNRRGPKNKAIRKKITETMKGKCNNPSGITKIAKINVKFMQRERMRVSALKRWQKVRNEAKSSVGSKSAEFEKSKK